QAFVIGVAAAQQNALVRAAQRHMLALSQAINETVVLRVREGLETVCVARCETTHEIRTIGSVGNRRPVGLGASGKVLLAFAPDAVRNEYFARVRKAAQGDPLRLVEELDAISRKGYAVSVGEVTAG
ncbi:IclR family transcriptional regulator domain-containing protein, partial [Burkholderia pseudomallei]